MKLADSGDQTTWLGWLVFAHVIKTRQKMATKPRAVVPLENPQKSSHCLPDEGCDGLVLPNPSRCAFIGGVDEAPVEEAMPLLVR